jgi:hypothetical protein
MSGAEALLRPMIDCSGVVVEEPLATKWSARLCASALNVQYSALLCVFLRASAPLR